MHAFDTSTIRARWVVKPLVVNCLDALVVVVREVMVCLKVHEGPKSLHGIVVAGDTKVVSFVFASGDESSTELDPAGDFHRAECALVCPELDGPEATVEH